MSKKISNTKIPANEHFPYGGYFLRRRLDCGSIAELTIVREHGANNWMYAQQIKDARKKLADMAECP